MSLTAPIDFGTGSLQQDVAAYLNTIGLGSLTTKAITQYLANPNDGEFLLWLRGTDEYKQRFPYAEDLRKQGVPFTEAGAISYENSVRQLLHSVGAPPEFATQDYLNKLIAGNISFNELEQRVAGGLQDYYAAPQAVKDEFTNQLGSDAGVVAFFLDPDHTITQLGQIKAGALVRGYGKQFGLDINAADAGQFAYGQSAQQIQQQLGQVDQLGALGRGTIDQKTTPFTDTQLATDVFSGNQGEINKQLEQRAAQFSDAGGAVGTKNTGFGSSQGA